MSRAEQRRRRNGSSREAARTENPKDAASGRAIAGWPLQDKMVVMILAGGVGERLLPMTADRSKPAVPFGGNFRIIDFTLNNCLMSGIRRMYVLTQYHALSLNRHLRERWGFLPRELGEFIEAVPSKLRTPSGVYQGTADAIFRNLDILEEYRPEVVLVLSGDHIYRADYRAMVEHHINTEADVTVLAGEVEAREASQFGVLHLGPNGDIEGFVEKPADPMPHADLAGRCQINLGIYCFNTRFLVQRLVEDAKRKTAHDFGRNVLPASVEIGKVVSYTMASVSPDSNPYWRDVGSIDSYFDAHMDLLSEPPVFDLRDPRWPSGSRFEEWLPARVLTGKDAEGVNVISQGAVIGRAKLSRTVISPMARIEDGASLDRAVIFAGARVGQGAKLQKVIVEAGIEVPERTVIGYGRDRGWTRSPGGVVVIGRGHPFAAARSTAGRRIPTPTPGQ